MSTATLPLPQHVLTQHTCSDACWYAREAVCHCSCGGLNHGVLLVDGAEKPARTMQCYGVRFKLVGVGLQWEMHGRAVAINTAAGVTFLYADSAQGPEYRKIPAKVKSATQAQFEKWPELKAARETYRAAQADAQCRAEYDNLWPYLLWEKE